MQQFVIGGSQHFTVCGGHGGNGGLLLVGERGEVLDTPVEGDITGYIEEDTFVASPALANSPLRSTFLEAICTYWLDKTACGTFNILISSSDT